MLLQTERLLIRELLPSDLQNIHALHSLAATDEYNALGIPATIEVTEKITAVWLAEQQQQPRTFYTFCIELRCDKQFIGLIALRLGKPTHKTAEVWYKLHIDYWRKGYATEALGTILNFGFAELKLHRIEAGCAVENVASVAVLQKAGMTKEGLKRKKLPIRGNWIDSYFYAILKDDFKQLASL